MLEIAVRRRLGEFALDAELTVPDRSITAIVGESGSGKTSLLRVIAGLLEPERGRVVVDGEVWFGGGRSLPAAARAVGWIPQDYALFPHLSARENVAFGLRAQRLPGREVRARTETALERTGIADLAGRRPRELSGGQQQRVAIARAIVLKPRILLMDEPMSALDARTRRGLRAELGRLLRELPCMTLYVTHSPGEALALGQRIAVLDAGRVTQSGTREELLRAPRTAYVAEFLGVNLFTGSLEPRGRPGDAVIDLPEGVFVLGPGEATALVRPRDITISLEEPQGSARNVVRGAIEEVIPEPPAGERVRIVLDTAPPLAAEVTRETVTRLGLAPGMQVFASFKASAVTLQP